MKFIDQEEEIIKSLTLKTARPRIRFSKYQEDVLNLAFSKNPYPNKFDKSELNILTGIPIRNLKIWFQNKRTRNKDI